MITKINRIINEGNTVVNNGIYTPELITTNYEPFYLNNSPEEGKNNKNFILNNSYTDLYLNNICMINGDLLFKFDLSTRKSIVSEPNITMKLNQSDKLALPPFSVLDMKDTSYSYDYMLYQKLFDKNLTGEYVRSRRYGKIQPILSYNVEDQKYEFKYNMYDYR